MATRPRTRRPSSSTRRTTQAADAETELKHEESTQAADVETELEHEEKFHSCVRSRQRDNGGTPAGANSHRCN